MTPISLAIFLAALLACSLSGAGAAEIVLIDDGTSRCAIHVPPEVMAVDQKMSGVAPHAEQQAEAQRQRLRDSVRDLAATLEKMSGAAVEIHERPFKAGEKHLPLLVGAYAQERFGPPGTEAPFGQGWRLVVSDEAAGFIGQSDESTSYAIYELLDRLGCRWFMPGELGEVIPQRSTVQLPEIDVADTPDTPTRLIWYASEEFKRRNRLGGFMIAAGHALDKYLTLEQLTEHPEWNAQRNGERRINSGFLCWGNPEVSTAVADSILAKLDERYVPSVSLSPKDGMGFCECEEFCQPLDAGDWDPTINTMSITDRYIVFCNRIAEKVTQKYPDVRFGFLAYVHYTRPPVREKLHPALVPQIAPISYCRAHTALSDNCPSRPQIKPIIEGWTQASKTISYYNYNFHLAEVAVPYPMMRQMADELPILYASGTPVFWQPETMPNFDGALPGNWLSIRMAWDNTLAPAEVYEELFTSLYGPSAPAMRRYWEVFDEAWTQVPAHAGCGWSYMRRFTPDVLAAARAAMDDAIGAARTPLDYRRVKLFDDSLRQFERFMALRHDLAEGRLRGIGARSTGWYGTQVGLGEEYGDNSAFLAARWSKVGNIAVAYFQSFFGRTYQDAERIESDRKLLFLNPTPGPLRQWRYRFLDRDEADKDSDTIQLGEAQDLHTAAFDDSAWPTTDSCVDTWSDLGLLGKYGTMWYRTSVSLPALPEGKRVYLWIAATDGRAKVFVNGKHAPQVLDDGGAAEVANGYCKPFSFDITDAVKSAEDNTIVIAGMRHIVNELGTGGLLGPAYLYRQK